jgi:hypothetical protein
MSYNRFPTANTMATRDPMTMNANAHSSALTDLHQTVIHVFNSN